MSAGRVEAVDALGDQYEPKKGQRVRHWNTSERGSIWCVHRNGLIDVKFDGFKKISKDWEPKEFFREPPLPKPRVGLVRIGGAP